MSVKGLSARWSFVGTVKSRVCAAWAVTGAFPVRVMSKGFFAPDTLLAIWRTVVFTPPLLGEKVTVKVAAPVPAAMLVPLSKLNV
jgi:hypothetical protein